MSFQTTIDAFCSLGQWLRKKVNPDLEKLINSTAASNPWFRKEDILFALNNLAERYLEPQKLKQWTNSYDLGSIETKTVGLIMAGNLPLVGWHDIQSVLISGHKAQIKLSHRDNILIPFLLNEFAEFAPEVKSKFEIVERLKTYDAVIATGSTNTNRYFEQYFSQVPHLFRGTKNGLAVINGNETAEDLKKLGQDVFRYYGLGCRSVSKLLVPKGYSFTPIFEAFNDFDYLKNDSRYFHNFEYSLSLLILNGDDFFHSEFLAIKRDQKLGSSVGCLNFESYEGQEELEKIIKRDAEGIQCLVSNKQWVKDSLDFGETQFPELWNYADGIDSMKFLERLGKD